MKLRSGGGAKNGCCVEIVCGLGYVKYDPGNYFIHGQLRRFIPDSVVQNILAKRIDVVIRVLARIFIRCHISDRGIVLLFSKTVEIRTSVAQ